MISIAQLFTQWATSTLARKTIFVISYPNSPQHDTRHFVKQNINVHENFEGIDDLMCLSYKIQSLLDKLPLNRAADTYGIFAEYIFMLIQACATSSVVTSSWFEPVLVIDC